MRSWLVVLFALAACGQPGPRPALAPSQQYAQMLAQAGLDSTRLGRAWVEAGAAALAAPVPLGPPGSSRLGAEAGAPGAWAWRVDLRRGEVLHLEIAAPDSAQVFVDLFAPDSTAALLGGWSAGSDTLRVEQPADRDGGVVLRVWPEVLAEGAVWVRVWTAPSLAFPVTDVDQGAIQSRWGASRDGGARSHEGIDIFAERGTPVVAGAAGQVSRVQETPIGGLVVWLRAERAPVSLYYAHLDRQSVEPGDRVAAGDTLGTVGNTGNAAATPPHLHFGIYARGGAIDPEPFVVGRRPDPQIRR